MSSDKARLSYDETRQYRQVVSQQGRVTLEADWNEAQQIASEELRRETLDIVGPCGTPDDGYRIVETGKHGKPVFDIEYTGGTMYVGGLRVSLPKDQPHFYSNQPEWVDHLDDP